MKFIATISSLVALTAAAPDPLITPRAEVAARQDTNPAALGYVSASTFSDLRSCDYPATLSRSGSLAQCCQSSSCIFWSSCSAGTLFASQTSLFCDQGYCNTAVLVPTVGASSGQNYLGCWATSLGQSPFTIVADVGSAAVGVATGSVTGSSSARATGASSGGRSNAATSATGSATPASSSVAVQSSGAAEHAVVQPLTGLFGLVAMVFGML
ncbi:hypothetical protein HBI56_139470 [Parastagonospora nodorum]|uniref:Uncharacterized protein n=1 Tax=Phaeosphaeria nodorum (strain SN15 / ATCC MYA-4574 / FGSC 10173) TaxID=321614 RepID=A0A7U2NPF2_PHANO|nr:hypothetical protein HBH56_128330 [Parastagonospora nodorum]QRD05672.1 hypothetical protein JI435_059520 [Parastagonospora nodorum SN15]KAH3931670.1 hypothetical protein HBH54_095150 [Parastagonospora nodorum]KAH3947195.1 hypothetical protein HBH53_118630 [Parastagonospora nodorum]KAH3970736.1 hypothetical protein HBH51_115040 [Parastagonospora nodorum]